MENSTLLCFDLNGTLFSGGSWLSDEVKNKFMALVKKHKNWCIVTAMTIAPAIKKELPDADGNHFLENVASKGDAIKNFILKHKLEITEIIAFDDMASNLADIKEKCSSYTVKTHAAL